MKNDKTSQNYTLNRRNFVTGIIPVIAGATIPSWASAKEIQQTREDNDFPGLITREKKPLNMEFPFPTLKNRITPNNQFFIRSHFNIPNIDATNWELEIGGNTNHVIKINLSELRKLPAKKVMATIECAGNGRANLAPKVKGLGWEQGGISNAEWTGVPLSVLLKKAGIKVGTVDIILEGNDEGMITEEPKSPGKIKFARSIPLNIAMQDHIIIAYEMNGKPLSAEHGFPARAIIPGWYGMASVKWLMKITASEKPFDGYWQTIEYAYWKRVEGLPTLTPVTTTLVKSEISRPVLFEAVPAGKPYQVRGAGWSGDSNLSKVEISTDKGNSWQPAKLIGPAIPFAWQLFEFEWVVPAKTGRYSLMARATDQNGKTQPMEHDLDRRTYMVNFISPIDVDVI